MVNRERRSMAWFGSVSGAQVDDFAKSLVKELERYYPPPSDEKQRKISQKKILSVMEGLFTQAREFRKQHKLGVYKKARLANTFRWELKEKGYDAKFVELATEGLLAGMTRKD
jgi:hypothetical protein